MEIALAFVGLCCIVLGLCQRKKPREDTIEEQIASLRRDRSTSVPTRRHRRQG